MYLYPYSINTEIFRQNENKFEKYPKKQIYLLSLVKMKLNEKSSVCVSSPVS